MTAVSGVNLRDGEAYWELSGPLPSIRNGTSCRSCRKVIYKGENVYCRDGRKLRFFYHEKCFTGDADPRTQTGGSYDDAKNHHYHVKSAPNVSSLEGPKAYRDPDGRVLGREVFKDEPPSVLGTGKWSVSNRGYNPSVSTASMIHLKK